MFLSLENIKKMLRNQHFYLDRIGLILPGHMEGHIACDFDNGDLMGPPSSSARVLEMISSSDNDQ